VILWIDGAFGSGKTTLVSELRGRLPEAWEFDPEYVGAVLRRTVPQDYADDFQDLPPWRTLTAAFVTSLSEAYGRTLLVPMTLSRPEYRDEIFGLIGEPLTHVFLDVTAAELRRRITAQVLVPADADADEAARQWRLSRVDSGVAARDAVPAGSLVLDVGSRTPAQLADEILTRVQL
jgi:hypothetical protein